jgi:uncharacterized protein YdeI (YjbR/CyaY-like superfamily)
MEPKDNSFYAENRKAWRAWLSYNAESKPNIWLIIYHKDSSKPNLTYDEAVEEALCFGWIDSKPNKRDEESYFLFFAQRKPKSNWSKANRERAERMIKSKKMTEKGMKMIDLAKKTGSWLALKEIQDSILPNDLKRAFKKTNRQVKISKNLLPHQKESFLSGF